MNNKEIHGYIDRVFYQQKIHADDTEDVENEDWNDYYRMIIKVIGSNFEEHTIFGNSYSAPEINDIVKCMNCVKKQNTECDYDTNIMINISLPENEDTCISKIHTILLKLQKDTRLNITKTTIKKYVQKMKDKLWKQHEIPKNAPDKKLDAQYLLLTKLINEHLKKKNIENNFEYKVHIQYHFFNSYDIILNKSQLNNIYKCLDNVNVRDCVLENCHVKNILYELVNIMKKKDLNKICTKMSLTPMEIHQIDVLYCIHNELRNKGHTYVPIKNIIGMKNLSRVVEELEKKKLIVVNNNNLSIKHIYEEEEKISQIMLEHMNQNKNILDNVSDFVIENNNDLSSTQKKCIYNVFEHNVSIITGFPGVGKSYVAKHIAQMASHKDNNPKLKVALLGPTGKIVSKLKDDIDNDAIAEGDTYTIHRYIHKHNTKHHEYSDFIIPDIIIIDESSMMSNELLIDFLQTIDKHQRIVFMGDVEQIGPIGYGHPFNELINSQIINVVNLTEIKRGKTNTNNGDKKISEHVKDFRENKKKINYDLFDDNIFKFVKCNTLEHCKHELNNRLINDKSTHDKQLNESHKKNFFDNTIIITPTHSNINFFQQHVKEIVNNNATYDKFNVGDFVMTKKNVYIKSEDDYIEICEEKTDCSLCTKNGITVEHDEHICIHGNVIINDILLKSEYDIFNGTVGKISKYENFKYTITTQKNDDILIDKSIINKYVSLSYLNTVHKYQGSEADNVYVIITRNDMYNVNWNLIYTAMSRSKNKCTIIAEKDVYEKGIKKTQKIHSNISTILNTTHDSMKIAMDEKNNVVLNKTENNVTKDKHEPYKKAKIPSPVKRQVWNKYIGIKKGEAKCYCCKLSDINQMSFHAGHVISEKNGGEVNVNNLKPICQNCNSSMGTMNMNDFIEKYGLHKNICDEQMDNASNEQTDNASNEQNNDEHCKQTENLLSEQNNETCDKQINNVIYDEQLDDNVGAKLLTKKQHKTTSHGKSIMDYTENNKDDVKISAKKQHKSKNIMDYLS